MGEWRDDEQEDLGAQELRKQEFRTRYATERDVPKIAKIMANVKATKERLEEELKVVNAEFDVLRIEVMPTAMEEAGLESARVAGVGRVSLTGDMYVRLPKQHKKDFFFWLRRYRLGDIIQETINSSTLKAFVKNRIKQGKPFPKELLTVEPFTRASITKE